MTKHELQLIHWLKDYIPQPLRRSNLFAARKVTRTFKKRGLRAVYKAIWTSPEVFCTIRLTWHYCLWKHPKKFRRKATYAILKLCLSACDGLIGFFHGNLMVYYGDISIEKTECLNVQ